ncbi:hypothetical protein BC936DRAFT_145249 [Jimgerdemannia flammicorona]|uniref:Ubiquitin-like protease family profile domain-containing protein n=1 Tax=Jimgerdemannia flammicorona TaxID=994334 RepID=A0A433DAI7_9FUNG|nr:hypothetical protein BC936DRAFT_145249 [Jimgerdemannia flammicorona]
MANRDVVIQYYDVMLRKDDVRLLNDNMWFNDTIIEFYYEHVSHILFPPPFHLYLERTLCKSNPEILLLRPGIAHLISHAKGRLLNSTAYLITYRTPPSPQTRPSSTRPSHRKSTTAATYSSPSTTTMPSIGSVGLTGARQTLPNLLPFCLVHVINYNQIAQSRDDTLEGRRWCSSERVTPSSTMTRSMIAAWRTADKFSEVLNFKDSKFTPMKTPRQANGNSSHTTLHTLHYHQLHLLTPTISSPQARTAAST